MTEEDDEIDEHEHAARAEREPLDGECLVLCGFAPSLLMLRGGQPLDIERLRRPVDAARMALRAHIERANYCTRALSFTGKPPCWAMTVSADLKFPTVSSD